MAFYSRARRAGPLHLANCENKLGVWTIRKWAFWGSLAEMRAKLTFHVLPPVKAVSGPAAHPPHSESASSRRDLRTLSALSPGVSSWACLHLKIVVVAAGSAPVIRDFRRLSSAGCGRSAA